MEESGSIVTLAVLALLTGYLGYRINAERNRLREAVSLLGENDVAMIDSLESLVRSGEIKPVGA
ncbi:MAG: hypothetical protein U0795_06255 [Pirellulales bacterium]